MVCLSGTRSVIFSQSADLNPRKQGDNGRWEVQFNPSSSDGHTNVDVVQMLYKCFVFDGIPSPQNVGSIILLINLHDPLHGLVYLFYFFEKNTTYLTSQFVNFGLF